MKDIAQAMDLPGLEGSAKWLLATDRQLSSSLAESGGFAGYATSLLSAGHTGGALAGLRNKRGNRGRQGRSSRLAPTVAAMAVGRRLA